MKSDNRPTNKIDVMCVKLSNAYQELKAYMYMFIYITFILTHLWSSGQSSWLQIQRSRVRFPALPNFLRNSGFGTGSTQRREDN
jgi:hypothetical protein